MLEAPLNVEFIEAHSLEPHWSIETSLDASI